MPRLVMLVRWAIALCAVAIAVVATPAAAQTEAAQRAKVTRYVDKWLRDTKLPPGKHDTQIKLVDLNGDGQSEALVIVNGSQTCGSRGCTSFVLDLRGAEARSIGDFTAQTLEPRPTSTNGWRDLSLNGFRVTFQGGQYKSTGHR